MSGDELLPEGLNASVQGSELEIELEPVPAADTVSGAPRQGIAELGSLAGAGLGVWELRAGSGSGSGSGTGTGTGPDTVTGTGPDTVTDTEVDEFFVVLSGSAVIEFLDELESDGGFESERKPKRVEVRAGDVMRLVAGSRTRWTVDDHIRKVYIAPSEE